VRTTLVTALAAAADSSRRNRARKFLQGLSGDELQYIADFLGACILEAADNGSGGGPALAGCITGFQQARPVCCSAESVSDQDHKMILVLEYLGRSGLARTSAPVRAAGHA
jgi:hypothetical protein